MPMYDQAKWYYIIVSASPKRRYMHEKFYTKVLKYNMSLFVKRITKSHGFCYCGVDGHVYVVTEFYIFCGQKKLKKLIEEAHLLGLEDDLLIFERRI